MIRPTSVLAASLLLILALVGTPLMPSRMTVHGQSQTVHVLIKEFEFIPSKLNITTGTTVVWNNTGLEDHTSTDNETTPYWDSGSLSTGSTFSKFFGNPGIYHYYCVIHSIMKGYVNATGPVVQPPQSSSTVLLIAVGVIVGVAVVGGATFFLKRRRTTRGSKTSSRSGRRREAYPGMD